MATKKQSSRELKGPHAVRSWTEMDEKRDASPCVIDRHMNALRTRHRKLAKAELALREALQVPEDRRSSATVENLTHRRENAKAWLDFTVATLKEHLKFAVARYDGSLDEIRPLPNGKKRSAHKKKALTKARKLVSYYTDTLDEFLLAAAASAGSWRRLVCRADKHLKGCLEYQSGETTVKHAGKTITACKHVLAELERKPIPGHAGSEEAVKSLIEHAQPVIQRVKHKSQREPEVAEQLAWIEVVETARRFDPTNSNMARFNTYYTYRASRAVEIRAAKHAPPGKTRIKGKIVARGTLHVEDGEGDSALFHPTTVNPNVDLQNAVVSAMSSLSDEERDLAEDYLVDKVSYNELAAKRGVTVYQIRKRVAALTERLQLVLKDYATA